MILFFTILYFKIENKHSINFGINFINESLRKFPSTIFFREIVNLLNLFLRIITVLHETLFYSDH